MSLVDQLAAELIDGIRPMAEANGVTIYANGVPIAGPSDDDSPAPEDPTTLDELSEDEKAEKLAVLQAKWHERTHEIESELGVAMVDLVRAKANAKAAQKEVDKLAESLDFRYSSGPPMTLPTPAPRQTEMFDDESDDDEPTDSSVIENDDSRRLAVRLERLGLPRGILAKLKDAAVETIGDVASLTAINRPLESIPGIGSEKAETIVAAIAKFDEEWSKDPEVAVAKFGG